MCNQRYKDNVWIESPKFGVNQFIFGLILLQIAISQLTFNFPLDDHDQRYRPHKTLDVAIPIYIYPLVNSRNYGKKHNVFWVNQL